MHTLWLGVAKSVWHIWRLQIDEQGQVISDASVAVIAQRASSTLPPGDIPDFSRKVLCNMSHMKAMEWQSWVCVFSMFALKGVISEPHYSAWSDFVDGCRLICQHSLTDQDIELAEGYLTNFYRKFSTLLPWHLITPSFHFILHIPGQIRRFGSIYNQQCAGYERLNGFIAGTPNNGRCLESQVVERWYARVDRPL